MNNTGHLGDFSFQPPEDLDTGVRLLSVTESVIATIASMGFSQRELPRSGFRGEMPMDLTSQDDEELGDLLANLSQYAGYAESRLAYASLVMNEAQAQADYIRARIRIALKADPNVYGGKLTTKDRDDIVEIDPRVRAAKTRCLHADAAYEVIRDIRNSAQRDWESVSRRITQRGQEIERMRREQSVAGIPNQRYRRPT